MSDIKLFFPDVVNIDRHVRNRTCQSDLISANAGRAPAFPPTEWISAHAATLRESYTLRTSEN
jgi:hypothetical protein